MVLLSARDGTLELTVRLQEIDAQLIVILRRVVRSGPLAGVPLQ